MEASSISAFSAPGFVDKVDWDLYEWAFVESPWQTMLHDLRNATTRPDLEATLTGVLFGKGAELRWRKKRDGQFHCVAIQDHQSPAESMQGLELRRTGTRKFLLWGQPDGDTWWESRIPREITEYPQELRGKRVGMIGAEYEFEPTPDEPPVIVFRLVGFEKF